MKHKLTAKDIEEMEANSLLEALGNCIELNDLFLDRFCSEDFAKIMKEIPYEDREYILQGVKETHWFNGSPASNDADIWLDVSEIEWQFEGNPEDVFENPDDFTIDGDLAYLYIGYGLSIDFDRKELLKAIEDYKG